MRSRAGLLALLACAPACSSSSVVRPDSRAPAPEWRTLPLVDSGNVDARWVQIGWGKLSVDDGSLRTDNDPRGLGVLVYREEKLGNCQIRVVFKAKDARSNSGVFVRVADGILDQANRPGASFDRSGGGVSEASGKSMQESSEREEGTWFAVHRGYEVQIMDAGDELHRTGAIYSLAPSSGAPERQPGEWRTMLITLDGKRIAVDVDGKQVTRFDPGSPDVPARKQWFEPKREPERPEAGYIGLQTHDPGEVVWFREVSVRPLPK
jgi:3-keto-disaccharide hydrolase